MCVKCAEESKNPTEPHTDIVLTATENHFPTKLKKEKKTRETSVDLQDLVAAGMLQPDQKLFMWFQGICYMGVITAK